MGLLARIEQADIVNIAAVAAILLYLILVISHLVMAVQSPDPMEAMQDVLLWSIPILLNILATYGIVKSTNTTS